MHIVNEFAIAQALVTGVGIWTALATDNVLLDLPFRNSSHKVFNAYANVMQHLGEPVLVYCVPHAFQKISTFNFVVDEGNTI